MEDGQRVVSNMDIIVAIGDDFRCNYDVINSENYAQSKQLFGFDGPLIATE